MTSPQVDQLVALAWEALALCRIWLFAWVGVQAAWMLVWVVRRKAR